MINTIAFWDDFALLQKRQMHRRYFSPEIIRESAFHDPDYPFSYSSIHWCEELQKYRLWYNINNVVCKIDGKGQDEHFQLSLAESDDAIHWETRNYSGNPDDKNVVFKGSQGSVHGVMVYRDSHDPDRLYKCAASIDSLTVANQNVAPGVIATSNDGINWDENELKFKWGASMSDAYNCFLYNPVIGEYQLILRSVLTDRRICTSHSPDLVHWSKPEVMISPDSFDPACSEFYGMSMFYDQGIFYGFLWIFDTDMYDRVPWKFLGNVYSELVYSYDGLHWNRTHHKALPLQEIGEYGASMNYMFNITRDKTGENYLISTLLTMQEHGGAMYKELRTRMADESNELNMHYTSKVRAGRFCGLQSCGNGFLRTKQILLNGEELTINAKCPNGSMRVQLIDLYQKPVPGFSFDDSELFFGDETAWRPKWKKRSISELKGRRFGIEIELYTGCVYGISGDFYPFHGAMPQKGYGDPRIAEDVFGDNVDYTRCMPV
ncbi:MAG: hypothetical protein WCI51_05635 [Lentisphaerota bacterium]